MITGMKLPESADRRDEIKPGKKKADTVRIRPITIYK